MKIKTILVTVFAAAVCVAEDEFPATRLPGEVTEATKRERNVQAELRRRELNNQKDVVRFGESEVNADICPPNMATPKGLKPRAKMNNLELLAQDFKFEKDEDLDFALNSLRGRVGIGAGDFAGFDAGTKLLQPTVYAKKNPKADVFAREYAVRKFVNKKSDQFYGFAKHQGQNSNADALGASRRSMIVSFYQEGLKDAKKQEFLGKSIFEFPADLKTPVVSKAMRE